MAKSIGSLAINPTELSGEPSEKINIPLPPRPPLLLERLPQPDRIKPLSALGKLLLNSIRITAFVAGVSVAFQTLLLGDWFWPQWYRYAANHLPVAGALSAISLLVLAFPKLIPNFLGGRRIANVQRSSPRLWTFTRWGLVGFLLLVSLDIPIYFLVEGQSKPAMVPAMLKDKDA